MTRAILLLAIGLALTLTATVGPARAVEKISVTSGCGDGGMVVSPRPREGARESSLHRGLQALAKRTEGKAQAHATASAGLTEIVESLRSLCGPRAVRFAPIIDREARRSDVDPVLVVAVVRAESTCNPLAHSGAGDWGLGQIRLGTLAASGATREELLTPEVNLRLTAAWLAKCLAACPTLMGGLSRYRGAGCRDTKGSRRVLALWEFAKRKWMEQRRS